MLTFHHLVVDSLLAGEDYIEFVVATLQALRCRLQPPISIEHMQDAVGGVQILVLAHQVVVHLLVGCAKVVHVRLVGRGPRQLHLTSRTKRTHVETFFAEIRWILVVCLQTCHQPTSTLRAPPSIGSGCWSTPPQNVARSNS